MATLTDLPRVQLVQPWRVYDYQSMAKYAHGVGPIAEMIMHPNDDDSYSDYIAKMHSLDMAVHPWEI